MKKLGITTVEELLYHFPSRYCDYRTYATIGRLRSGQEAVIRGTVLQADKQTTQRGRQLFNATLVDDQGKTVKCVWFNQAFLSKVIKEGLELIVVGKAEFFRQQLTFQVAEYEIVKGGETKPSVHFGRIVPVYPETAGISSKWLRHKVMMALEVVEQIAECLPESTLLRQKLLPVVEAMREIHFPNSFEAVDQARDRLAFEELFVLQLRGLIRKSELQQGKKTKRVWKQEDVLAFLKQLPFELTGAQSKVLREILDDIAGGVPMRRLLEGDVGSGKTIVAALAMFVVAKAGFQATLMVPTEILAEQHFHKVTSLLKVLGLQIALLTGSKNLVSTPPDAQALLGFEEHFAKVNRSMLKEMIAAGKVDIVIGTQALIEADVTFKDVGLVIIDEQHRFGVEQRAKLHQAQEDTPDFLMMSATPIPRSLALALYGDLDLSVIDQLPPGRQKIVTRIIPPGKKALAYTFIRDRVRAGRQAFIICPLIEESEKLQLKSAKEEYERLSHEVFPDLSIGLLHGQMKPAEKDEVMRKFVSKEFSILISTTVIEVGIDVPNAVVMLIESAERFGLAQLHQLRGRVGRGEHQSYCVLGTESRTEKAIERLTLFVQSDDGFKIAEADLQLRGPGEVYGLKQSGLPDFRMASLTDFKLIERTRKEAEIVLGENQWQGIKPLQDRMKALAEKEGLLH